MKKNWMGVSSVSAKIPKEKQEFVEKKMEEIEKNAKAELEGFLHENGMELFCGKVQPESFVTRYAKRDVRDIIKIDSEEYELDTLYEMLDFMMDHYTGVSEKEIPDIRTAERLEAQGYLVKETTLEDTVYLCSEYFDALFDSVESLL